MSLNKKFFIGGAAGITATEYFAPVTYTGNGSTQSISSLSFAPDLIWFKDRSSSSENHWLFDVLRGTNIGLSSNLTGGNYTLTNTLNSFDTNGFTVGLDGKVNRSSDNYVAWAWKAGGTAVSNTDGTITSTVSASPESGFSIGTYTGNGTAGATIGHGISIPELLIVKRRSSTEDWATYVSALGATASMALNKNAGSSGGRWNNTAPTDSVFSVNNHATVNASSSTYVFYAFHSVEGFSKIDSYNGTGSSGNAITGLGFEPRFLLIKGTSGTGRNWVIKDSARSTSNPRLNNLYPHLSNAENTVSSLSVDFDSDGFTLNGTSGDINASETYIYLAIA